MFLSDAMRTAQAAESACWAAASAVRDPDSVPASEAVRLYECLERSARAVAAAKVLLAKRVAASQEWKRKGHRSPAEHLAQISGAPLGAAKGELETSDALGGLPATTEALLDGKVSAAQGRLIAGAAKHNPGAEGHLLGKARTANHNELRDEALKAKAAGDPDPEATHARIHADRRLSRHTDGEGAWNLHARGTVEAGSTISNELELLTDEIFRARGKAGTTECRDAYAFDALVTMAHRSALLRHGAQDHDADTNARDGSGLSNRRRMPAPQHLALLRLDVEALWRGHVEGEELCEVTGLGPIPVAAARRLLGDAVLKLVLTRGEAVAQVTSLTRGPTQAMRYALLWTSPTCTAEGCTRTIVEHDHRYGAEFKDTGHTKLDELDRVCHGHHDLHTREGWALVSGTGKRPMVPPEDPRHPANAPPGGGERNERAVPEPATSHHGRPPPGLPADEHLHLFSDPAA